MSFNPPVQPPPKKLKKGKVAIKFLFDHKGNFVGNGELYIDGKKVDEVEMPRSVTLAGLSW